jgi:hypothetical protein
VIVPPSPGHCHSSGRQYRYLTSRDLTAVATITPAEREILLEAAKSFDALRPVEPPRRRRQVTRSGLTRHNRPGDDFNARGDWAEILERNGWTLSATMVPARSIGVAPARRTA